MSQVLRAVSTMMLCLLKLMKHTVIWSLLLYWRHSTWLGKWELHSFPKSWSWKICNWECCSVKKRKDSLHSIAERRVPELIPVLGSQPAGDLSHKPGGRLPLLSARPAVTPTILKRAASNFAAWWREARWVWTVCLRLLPNTIAAAIWTQAVLHLSPAH